MDQAGIIRDLLIWLEGHLDQPLSLDNVAAKAGYSSGTYRECLKCHWPCYWRVYSCSSFVEIGGRTTPDCASDSGHRAAIPLRLSTDIYRAFKKQFAQTPALYRRSPEWSAFVFARRYAG